MSEPDYRTYNFNRAGMAAANIIAANPPDDGDLFQFANDVLELTELLATGWNELSVKLGVDNEAGGTPSPRTSSRTPRSSSSSSRSSGQKSSRGKGRGLSDAQKRMVRGLVKAIEDKGQDAPNDVDSLEGIYSFDERNQRISELRLLAYYNGDVDAYEADTQRNKDNPLPDEYYS